MRLRGTAKDSLGGTEDGRPVSRDTSLSVGPAWSARRPDNRLSGIVLPFTSPTV